MAALGIDCDRLISCVVILSQTMLVVPFCTIFLLSHWGFIFIADYMAVRFHRPGFDAPDYCPINQRFQLACLMKRAVPEIFLLLWNKNLHSSLRSVVFFIPRPNISFSRLTLFGCQASETDGDIQIKKRRTMKTNNNISNRRGRASSFRFNQIKKTILWLVGIIGAIVGLTLWAFL